MLLSAVVSLALSAAEIKWQNDMTAASEAAKKEKKPVIMLFTGSDWCPPCMKMERTTWKDAKVVEKKPFKLGVFFNKNLLGIDSQYTKGDKVLAWSVFCYSFIYTFLILFVMVVVWNAISPWKAEAWGVYFFVKQFAVIGIIGIVSTFWFGIGGAIDLFRLFRDLEAKESNDLDDGRVVNNMSVADMQHMQDIDKEKDADKK